MHFFSLLAGLGACAAGGVPLTVGSRMPPLVRQTGTSRLASGGVVTYDALTVPDTHVIDLSSVEGVATAVCNVIKTSILLNFKSAQACTSFLQSIDVDEFTFIVGGAKYGDICTLSTLDHDVAVRRVVGGFLNPDPKAPVNTTLELTTVETHYDELFQEASIRLNSTSSRASVASATSPGADKQVCIGVNTVAGSDCTDAKAPIDLYKNSFVDITCQDCYLGFSTDVFVDITIHEWKLQYVAGGFRKMSVDAALVLQAASTLPNYGTGTDKTLTLVADTPILDFKIGLIPFKVSFTVPVEVKADATLQAAAQAQAGVSAVLDLGDLYLSWDPVHEWQEHTPVPKLTLNPVLAGSASFQGMATLSVIPSVILMVDKVFTYGITVTPTVTAKVEGSAADKQVCADLTYQVTVGHYAQFDINLDWAFIHKDISRHFGPKTLVDTGVKPLAHYCVQA